MYIVLTSQNLIFNVNSSLYILTDDLRTIVTPARIYIYIYTHTDTHSRLPTTAKMYFSFIIFFIIYVFLI